MKTIKELEAKSNQPYEVGYWTALKDVLGLLGIEDKGDFWEWCRNYEGFDYCDKNKQPIDFIIAFEEYLKARIEG